MADRNRGLCNTCHELVDVETVERDGQVFLRKLCDECGPTETLVSADLDQYRAKRSMDLGHDYQGCNVHCIGCKVHKPTPNTVFVDITNRCNMNCTCCIANIPAMGFQFNPPLEYFRRIFAHLGQMDPRPSLQLFGGEPTMRDDLFDIIQLAADQGLAVRVVTNGLKLADPEYCERLVATKSTILIAFDGMDEAPYRVLRNHPEVLETKLKALENLGKARKPKVVLMSLVARGLNDHTIAETTQKVHDEWTFVRSMQFIPLTHTWKEGALDEEPERITPEDVENIVDDSYGDQNLEFVPAGNLDFPTIRETFNMTPIPFGGVHPNCESMSLVFSDGQRFVPFGSFLKTPLTDMMRTMRGVDNALRERFERPGLLGKMANGLGLGKVARRFTAARKMYGVMRKHVDLSKAMGCSKAGVPFRMLKMVLTIMATGSSSKAVKKYTRLGRSMQLLILPFEDKGTLETHRLERCRAVFAFLNPHSDEVNTVPVCAWTLYNKMMLRDIAERWSDEEPAGAAEHAPVSA